MYYALHGIFLFLPSSFESFFLKRMSDHGRLIPLILHKRESNIPCLPSKPSEPGRQNRSKCRSRSQNRSCEHTPKLNTQPNVYKLQSDAHFSGRLPPAWPTAIPCHPPAPVRELQLAELSTSQAPWQHVLGSSSLSSLP